MTEVSEFDSFESLNLNDKAFAFLKEIAKWSFFLSIVGFVGLALLVIGGIFFGSLMGALSESTGAYSMGYATGSSIVYIIFGLIYFFPIFYLYKFSKQMKDAIKLKNNDLLTKALANLKSHYKFLGIFTIVVIGLYILLFVFGSIIGLSTF